MRRLSPAVRRALRTALLMLPLALAGNAARATGVPGRQDEADLNRRRTEWLEQIHRAAPGTDWRRIEAANRTQTMLELQGGPRVESVGWTERGAANLTGRNFDAAHTADGSLVIGSANGGLFRGAPSSGSWTPLTDNVGYGVEHVLVAPGAPDRILVASNSRFFVSTNGGVSWAVPSGLPDYVWTVARTVQEADAPLTMYALVEGWIWTGTAWDHNWHLLRSTDGGVSFTKIHTEPLATRPDIWISRTGPGALYMAVGNAFELSVDHGASWSAVGTLPATATQTRLAGSEAGAPSFYCMLYDGSSWSLVASTTGGASWSNRGVVSDTYGTLWASIRDPQQVMIGGVDCHRSLDGGVSFSLVNHWYDYYGNPNLYLHADIFGLRSFIEPVSPGSGTTHEVLYIHTDGGSYAIDPAAGGVANVTRLGFRNSQYYGTLTSLADPSVLSAGAQDQGYQVSNAGVGTVTPDFTQQISGDYAHLVSSWPDQSRMIWSVYPGFVLVQTGTGDAPGLEQVDFPSGQPGFKFLPATCADLDDVNAAYVGARQIWHLHRDAPNSYTWTPLAQDFDHGDGDIVGALAWAATNHARGYAATYNGRLYSTTDQGATWTEAAVTGPPSHYFAGSSIVVSPTNPLLAWVGGSGYSNAGVYATTDGGATWSPMAAGLPSTQVYAMALEGPGSNVLYAATQAGPFRWNGSTWENLLVASCCAPLTDYWDVESIPHRGIVRFSTYGRGIWDYATGSLLAAPARPEPPVLDLAVAPNPVDARARVRFTLPASGLVDVQVFDVQGHRLRTIASGWRAPGPYSLAFEPRSDGGRPFDSGLYLVRVRSARGVAVTRFTIAR